MNDFPAWLIALPFVVAAVVVIAPSVGIIARNLRRAGAAAAVGGVSSAVVAVASTHADPSLVPATIAAGIASTAAASYLAHPERTWFNKQLGGRRFKRTDIPHAKTSKGVRTSLGGRPKVKSKALRIKPNH